MERITKAELAEKMNISRPTLDKYLKEGFPKKITSNIIEQDTEYEIIATENEIRLLEYKLSKLKEYLKELNINV